MHSCSTERLQDWVSRPSPCKMGTQQVLLVGTHLAPDGNLNSPKDHMDYLCAEKISIIQEKHLAGKACIMQHNAA